MDMEKGYDTHEWNCINKTLLNIGFPPKITSTIMKCINNVNFSILLNGLPTDKIIPTREIRQGIPISPYLFILCANVLSNLINKAQLSKELSSITISKEVPYITHLFFFPDDNLIFYKAEEKDAKKLLDLINIY